MTFIFESAIYGEPLLALLDIKRYINPALASALYRKKRHYIIFTSAIYNNASKALSKAKKSAI